MKKYFYVGIGLFLVSFTAFSQGFYFEFKITSSRGTSGSIKCYSQNENSRSEVEMIIPGAPGGGHKSVSLLLNNAPDKMYTLNETAKTYSEVSRNVSPEHSDGPVNDYEVTVIGKEKVNNYDCTHVKVKRISTKEVQDMWTTTEISDYEKISKVKSPYSGKDNLNKALTAKGAMGFPARIKTTEHGTDVQMDLVKAEARTNPATLFSLDGYKRTESPAGTQLTPDMINKMQNMNPEEREKMLKQLQEQYKH